MSQESRKSLLGVDTVVVKIGSRVLTGPDGTLDVEQVGSFSRQIARLAKTGKQVVLVSSGAVAAGMGQLGLAARPKSLAQLQAVAAVGQALLIQFYESFLSSHGFHAAQILLTADDLDDRRRYLNVRNTLRESLRLGVVPIINENDSVAVDELQTTFGDNDRLAASVAGVIGKGALLILSDVEGVYDRDPRQPDATIISQIAHVDSTTLELASGGTSSVGKGGMESKLRAASIASRSGIPAVIAGGRVDDAIVRIMTNGEPLGTYFPPDKQSLAPRKRWIEASQAFGTIQVDAGAARALGNEGSSLLAIGITGVTGSFACGDVVAITGPGGVEVGRGLTNFSSDEVGRICGLQSSEIEQELGHSTYDEVIHRDNMSVSQ